MELPPIDDHRLEILIGAYTVASGTIASLLDRLLDTPQGPERFLIFRRIKEQISGLEAATNAWAAEFIPEFVEEAGAQAISAAEVKQRITDLLETNLTGTLEKGRQSTDLLVNRVFRASALENEFPQIAAQVQRKIPTTLAGVERVTEVRNRIASVLREQFKDGLVSVIGKDGRKYSFPLDTYAGMVAQSVKQQAKTQTTLASMQETGQDLVMVSPNPSLRGDWCDAYRGKVYSVSGGNPFYPPLNSIPPGPPFHPWCRHFLSTFVPEKFTAKQQAQMADTNPAFLMSPGEEDPNRVVRNWWAIKRGAKPESAPVGFS